MHNTIFIVHFWRIGGHSGGDYHLKEKGGSIKWEEGSDEDSSTVNGQIDYSEESSFADADAVRKQEGMKSFEKKNFGYAK